MTTPRRRRQSPRRPVYNTSLTALREQLHGTTNKTGRRPPRVVVHAKEEEEDFVGIAFGSFIIVVRISLMNNLVEIGE